MGIMSKKECANYLALIMTSVVDYACVDTHPRPTINKFRNGRKLVFDVRLEDVPNWFNYSIFEGTDHNCLFANMEHVLNFIRYNIGEVYNVSYPDKFTVRISS